MTKKKILSRFFPKEYDFYKGLFKHITKVEEGIIVLIRWFKTGEEDLANRVRAIEHEADDIMLEIAAELGQVFSTPIDREDIYLLSNNIDQIINYAKNTVREMEIFSLSPDKHMVDISLEILEGTCALRRAVKLLPKPTPEMRRDIEKAIKSERNVEKLYRLAVSKLFEGEDLKEILKRREVYRHLSNTADRIETTADLLSIIAVKYA